MAEKALGVGGKCHQVGPNGGAKTVIKVAQTVVIKGLLKG